MHKSKNVTFSGLFPSKPSKRNGKLYFCTSFCYFRTIWEIIFLHRFILFPHHFCYFCTSLYTLFFFFYFLLFTFKHTNGKTFSFSFLYPFLFPLSFLFSSLPSSATKHSFREDMNRAICRQLRLGSIRSSIQVDTLIKQ